MNRSIEPSQRKLFLSIFLISLTVIFLSSLLIHVPGYMDAEYYYLGGKNIASGKGFSEMILWNYLDDPAGLPNPSHTYWMPLASIISAAGLVFGSENFLLGKLPFILLAACIPVVTSLIAMEISGKRKYALLSGSLALFSGYYFVYYSNIETFTPFILLGALFVLLLLKIDKTESQPVRILPYLLLGTIAGLMHLTRTDGVLWAAGAGVFIIVRAFSAKTCSDFKPESGLLKHPVIVSFLVLFIGYLLPLTPWFLRNLMAFNSILSTAGGKTLWLTDYNQTFIYPSSALSMQNWWAAGVETIVQARASASLDNLKTFLGVEAQVIYFPLIILGLGDFRWKTVKITTLFIWAAIFILMSFLFPFAGQRGGFLHASAGLQPFIWAIVPMGLARAIEWGKKNRDWRPQEAWRIFSLGLIVIALLVTSALFIVNVYGGDINNPAWERSWQSYQGLENEIQKHFPDKSAIVSVNNPPGYHLASRGRPAIVIPDSNLKFLHEVLSRYHVSVLAVDKNIVPELKVLYDEPKTRPGLAYMGSYQDFHIYQVVDNREK